MQKVLSHDCHVATNPNYTCPFSKFAVPPANFTSTSKALRKAVGRFSPSKSLTPYLARCAWKTSRLHPVQLPPRTWRSKISIQAVYISLNPTPSKSQTEVSLYVLWVWSDEGRVTAIPHLGSGYSPSTLARCICNFLAPASGVLLSW